MKTLHLTLKKKWFDMIASGEKKEEYREIKPFWIRRLHTIYKSDKSVEGNHQKPFDKVFFRNGYASNAPTMEVEFKGLDIGPAKPEWSDNWQGDVFIIKLGDIISRS